MNSDFVIELARTFANRLAALAGSDPTDQVQLAWQTAYARLPEDMELAEAVQFLTTQTEIFAAQRSSSGKDADDPGREALASLCHAILSSNAFLYVD